MIHGIASTYTNHDCRCAACKEAWRVLCRQQHARRKARLAANPRLATHGKASTYGGWGCRCLACTEAFRLAYQKRSPRQAQTQQIITEIRERIETGEYRPGDRIPTAVELTEIYGITYSTARTVARHLMRQGLIETRLGGRSGGTYVKDASRP